jgi:hypothetical protein
MRKVLLLAGLLLMLPALTHAQGIPIKSGATSDLATVDTNKNLRSTLGASTRPTYIASVSGATTTAAYDLQVESSAGTGFKVARICVSYSLGATAAGTIITTTVSRRTTASSGGTALTNEGTGATAISKLDPSAGSFGGLARGLAATLGSAGATLDQWQFPQTVVAGTTGITQPAIICKDYGIAGEQQIINPAGVNNGIAVNVSAGGAGSLATGAITMTIISE